MSKERGKPGWMTSAEARRAVGVSTCQIAHLRQEAKIGYRKEGNAYLYSAADVSRFASQADATGTRPRKRRGRPK
jgi:hypothetical protein